MAVSSVLLLASFAFVERPAPRPRLSAITVDPPAPLLARSARRATGRFAVASTVMDADRAAGVAPTEQPLGQRKRLRALALQLQKLPRSAGVEQLDELLGDQALMPKNMTTLLLTLRNRQKWRIAVLIAEWAEIPGCPVPFTTMHYNLLMAACVRRAPARALYILKRMKARGIPTGIVTHNTAMAAQLGIDDHRAALATFDKIEALGLQPSTISYNTAISACARAADAERALELFRQMESGGIERTTVTYTGLIHACAEGMQLDKAMALFTYMEVAGVERNLVTYSVAINACTRNGQWELGLQLLHEMARRGVQPDTVIFNAAISACEKGRAWDTALRLMAQMRQVRAPSRTAHTRRKKPCLHVLCISCLVQFLVHGHALVHACEHGISHSPFPHVQMGLQPSAVTYGAAISACEKVGECKA